MLTARRTAAALLTTLLLALAGALPAQAAEPIGGDTMRPGQALAPGDWVMSADRTHGLTYQQDGNLVAYGPGDRPLWSAGTSGRPLGRFQFGADGNVGILGPNNDGPYWQSGTFCGPQSRLTVQNDGNVVIYCPDNRAAFYTGWDRTGLNPGEALLSGHRITSANNRYHLELQTGGNVVMYGPGGRPVWFTGSYGADSLRLQADGNLVAYSGNRPAWNSDTWREGRLRLEVQNDGNVVLYRTNGSPAWYSAFDTGRPATSPSAGVRLNPVTPPPGAYYPNCDAARAARVTPLYAGQPGYRPELDRDRDGIACEE